MSVGALSTTPIGKREGTSMLHIVDSPREEYRQVWSLEVNREHIFTRTHHTTVPVSASTGRYK